MDRRFVHAQGRIDTSTLRSATLLGVEYIVAPVTMLVGDNVIEPQGAIGPEFVPAHLLESGVGSWAGRPITYDHPAGPTANDPLLLESLSFGYVFNPRYDNKALKAEIWIDPLRAAKVGAGRVVERLRNHDTIDVSIGAWTRYLAEPGAHLGKSYIAQWSDALFPDHLAILPEGTPGACTLDMGCGVFNTNSKGAGMEKLQKFLSGLKTLIDGVDPDYQSGDNEPDCQSSDNDNEVARAACKCETSASQPATPPEVPQPLAEKGQTVMNPSVTALVGRILQAADSPYGESDRATLELLSEPKLTRLADALAPVAAPPPVAPPTVVASPPDDDEDDDSASPPAITEAQLPPELRDLLAQARQVDAHLRSQHLAALTGAVTSGIYTNDELSKLPTSQLEKLARLSGTHRVDMSLRGVPVPDDVNQSVPPAPDIYDIANRQKAYQDRQAAGHRR